MRGRIVASVAALVTAVGVMTVPATAGAVAAPVVARNACNTPDVSYNRNSAALYCPGPIAGSTNFKIRIFCTTGTVEGPWRRVGGGLASAAGCHGGTINQIHAIVD